jgi:hypothetical protein
MTQMWYFKLPEGMRVAIALDWAYVPYIEELQKWIWEHWDEYLEERVNWQRFYGAAERFMETGRKPKHPIAWVLEKTREHLDGPD